MQVNTRKIVKNSFWLYVRMIIVTIVSLYTSRIVLQALGVDDYGIYNIAGGVIAFINILTTGMNSSMQRYLNVCKGEEDYVGLAKLMNISTRLFKLVGLFLLIIGESVGLFVVAKLLVFPGNRQFAAIMVYEASLLTLMFAFFKIPYTSLVVTYERFSFVALLSLLEVIIKMLVAFCLLYVNTDALIFYGFSFTILEICMFLIYRFYCLKLYMHNTMSWRDVFYCDESKRLMKFSFWSMLSSIGSTCANHGITIMFNFFFPLSVNAAIGITNQVTNVLSSFISNVQQAFRPQLIQSFTNCDGSFGSLICSAAKWSFVLMIAVGVPLACNLEAILQLWLGTVPNYTYHFILILMVFLFIDTLGAPISYAIDATGKISRYHTLSFIIMLSNLFLAWIICMLGLNPPYVIATKLLANSAIIVLRIITLSRNSNEFSIRIFYVNCIRQIIPIFACAILCFCVSFYLDFWSRILLTTVGYLFCMVVLVYLFCMNQHEKVILSSIIKKIIKY